MTRKELQERLWPTDTFVDFEHAIGSVIYKIRVALADDAANPRFIETLSNQSYRFLAPVRSANASVMNLSKMRLAVLPFTSSGNTPKLDYFAEGVTDELISQLGRLHPQRLGVIARTSTMAYRNTTRSLSDIGRELNAEYIIEGSVRHDRSRVRITAQLVRLPDQTPIWTETYDHPRKKILDTQITIARCIAEALTLELIPEQWDLIKRSLPQHAEAYDLYLRGRHLWNQRSESAMRDAISLFNRALERDPQYALAHTGIADAYAVLGYYGMLPGAFTAAKSAAEKALQLDGTLAEAHSTLAFATLQHDWDWITAEKHHKLAIQLNPNCASAFHWYGIDLTQVGLFDEAIQMLRRAQVIDPLKAAVIAHIGRAEYFRRDFEKAILAIKEALELDPDYAPSFYFLGLAQLEAGCGRDAIATLQQGAKISRDHPAMLSGLAHVLWRCGKKSQAEQVVESLNKQACAGSVSSYYQAFALAAAPKRPAQVIRFLEDAAEKRHPWVMYLNFEPAFDLLRSDAKFTSLIKKIPTVKAKRAAGR